MEESAFYRFIKPVIPERLRPLALRFQELMAYTACGFTATLINFGVFYGLHLGLGVNYLVANVIAWFLSIVYAFLGNKIFVFEDKRWDLSALMQFAEFLSARLFSLGLEEGILYVCVDVMGCNENIIKLIALAVVTASNYIFAKLLIFRRK